MFCNVCIDALEHRKGWCSDDEPDDPKVLLAHHQSAASLEASALAACELCYPFWRQISDEDQARMRKFDIEWNQRHGQSGNSRVAGELIPDLTGLVTVCMIINIGKDDGMASTGMDLFISLTFEWDYREEIQVLKQPSGLYVVLRGPEREGLKKTHLSSPSTSCAEPWSLATAWINKCATDHQACNTEANTGSWHPTRLLDLARPDASLDTFRIVKTSELDLPSSERYTTLSHCWGSAQFLQLLKSNLEELKSGIAVDRLPKTFREAIEVTRKLGVRFLWIDSLCILQDRDDLSDWLVEAAQMHKVYSRSYCNISAAGAVDSSKGLFSTRDTRISQSSNLHMCVGGLGLSLGTEYADCNILDFNFWSHGVAKCPLNTRGWVMQERLLSPRVLHFARDQLFWECREHSAAECYPDELPGPIRNCIPANFKRLEPATRSRDLTRSGTSDADESKHYHKVWDHVVRAYSSTRLTHGSDKLIALSGVAKYFSVLIGDEYVVGMWKRYLESSLLWHILKHAQVDGSPSARPLVYRAPSFTWASVDGVVRTVAPTKSRLLFEVVSYHLDYVTEDTTGLVKGGYIELKGQLRPFAMIVKNIEPVQQLLMLIYGNTVRDPKKEDGDNGPVVNLDVGQKSFDDDNVSGRLYYMPTQQRGANNEPLYFLLLSAIDTDATTFKRIGVAVATEPAEMDMLLRPSTGQDANDQEDPSGAEWNIRTIRII